MLKKYQPSSKVSNFKKKVFKGAGLVASFIYQIGETDELRKTSKEVSADKIKSIEFQGKIKYLKECLLKYRELTGYGRGITAVQVGIAERFSVIYMPDELLIIINPKIIKKSKKKYIYPEMCMSANPIIAPIIRPSWIEFEYLDEFGNKKYWNEKDENDIGKMMNRVVQHEIDHMDGIINIDKCLSKELVLESDPDFYKKAKFIKV